MASLSVTKIEPEVRSQLYKRADSEGIPVATLLRKIVIAYADGIDCVTFEDLIKDYKIEKDK